MNAASPTAARTLVEEKRWLLWVFGGIRIGLVLLFAGLLTAALVAIGIAGGARRAVPLAIGGVIYWTFVEYALHRPWCCS